MKKRFIITIALLLLCGCKKEAYENSDTAHDNSGGAPEVTLPVIETHIPTSENNDPGIPCPYIDYDNTRFYMGLGTGYSFCEYGGEDFCSLEEAMSVVGLADEITSYGEWADFIGNSEHIGTFESREYYLEGVGDFSTDTKVYRISEDYIITETDYLKSLYAISANGGGSDFLEGFDIDELTENNYSSYTIWLSENIPIE